MDEKAVTVLPVRQLCSIALMSALMCLLGPLSIPIGLVPISLMTLIIYLTLYVLGMKMGTISCIIYLLLGFVGVPVLPDIPEERQSCLAQQADIWSGTYF
ncbi:hypothetical protein C823_006639 [Eubacterium plexicaudatum ASF492]|nr:hypothetical protein C823_006639 [Eubacterium plexicaudatum ASF492]